MTYDHSAPDVAFAEGRPPDDLDTLLPRIRVALSLNGVPPWRLISARRKMGKTLFEIEEQTPHGPRRIIGKRGREERVHGLYRALRTLWDSRLRPPARFTVTEPLAFVPELNVVLQEKAPGRPLLDLLWQDPDQTAVAAGWLAHLHASSIQAPPPSGTTWDALWCEDLANLIPDHRTRLERMATRAVEALAVSRPTVACHGDFHAMNLFVDPAGRITAIDVDKFGAREPEADTGYLLAQTAALGCIEKGSFASTAEARRVFRETYRERAGAWNEARAGVYFGLAFLKNLHFELCLLKTGRFDRVAPYLEGAWQGLMEGRAEVADIER